MGSLIYGERCLLQYKVDIMLIWEVVSAKKNTLQLKQMNTIKKVRKNILTQISVAFVKASVRSNVTV